MFFLYRVREEEGEREKSEVKSNTFTKSEYRRLATQQ